MVVSLSKHLYELNRQSMSADGVVLYPSAPPLSRFWDADTSFCEDPGQIL